MPILPDAFLAGAHCHTVRRTGLLGESKVTHEQRSHDESSSIFPETAPGLSRRNILALAGLAGGAALLWGCESGNRNNLMPDLPNSNSAWSPRQTYNPTLPPTIKPVNPTNPPAPSADTFGIIPRSAWAKAGPDLKRVDPMNGVSLITFHHSGDPKPFFETGYAETAAHLEGVREYHRSKNFQDIGYHFAIDRTGRVWQLRSLAYEGQHVRNGTDGTHWNGHNIGVCVLGNFDLQTPTQAQKDKIKSFGQLLRKQYGLAANKVKTHQELVTTECPGRGMQPYMVQIRASGLV